MVKYKYLPSNVAHFLLPYYLLFRKTFFSPKEYKWKSFQWKNLYFKNPLGIAGGLDKSASLIKGWWTYGPGFIEIGTLTPKKQTPNSGTILKKSYTEKALWNYMGFPNKGAEYSCSKLKKLKKPYWTPIFASLGKNRTTSNEKSCNEYIYLIEKLHMYVDGFIINISSPNTQNLRELFQPPVLKNFLQPLISKSSSVSKPLLLKMSPDFNDEDFLKIIQISDQAHIDGWIICNSTLKRSSKSPFPKHGGVSGKPLALSSKHFLKLLVSYLKDRKNSKLIISCGGILSPKDVHERLQMGAHLVQVYSALVFNGLEFFEKTYQNSLHLDNNSHQKF